MTETVVHLIITGIIALQPMNEKPNQWRILVPNLQAHEHSAHVLVDSSTLLPRSTSGKVYTVFPLDGYTGEVSGVTMAGNGGAPQSLLQLPEICSVPVGDCGVLAETSAFSPAPALDLVVDQAALEDTWTRDDVSWYFERPAGKPSKLTKGVVAEEVCLKFTVPSDTFTLALKDAKGRPMDITVGKNSNGEIELEIANIKWQAGSGTGKTPDPAEGFENEDEHFHLYYGLTRRHRPEDVAHFRNDADKTKLKLPQNKHKHLLGSAPIVWRDVNVFTTSPIAIRGVQVPQDSRSVRGSNCPPIGAPAP